MSARRSVPAVLAALVCLSVALVAPSAGRAATATVKSFDGTRIHVNFFAAAHLSRHAQAPTVLEGPGWGSAGSTDANAKTDPSGGVVGIGPLRRAGYNVITWDPRGFGQSGGTVEVDSPRFEARDVSAIISWLAKQPQALLDAPDDPRVGMAGGSYGGGIQFGAAATDRRIDAIVPDIAWHSLLSSLDKNGAVKLGWSGLLYNIGKVAGHLDPLIGEAFATGAAGQPLTAAEHAFFASRGPGGLVGRVRVPTLLIQGTVDDLFTLQEAVTNYRALSRHHVPVKMLWFCGGHGTCLTDPGDQSLIQKDSIAWLNRYLKGDTKVRTGPGFQWVDQDGGEHTARTYPPPAGRPVTATGSGTLTLSTDGGSGPIPASAGIPPLSAIAASVAPARAANAVDVTVPARSATRQVVGAPSLTLGYSGTGSRPSTHVYAQVVDDATGLVLGNQITPIPVTLDGAAHTVTIPLEMLSAVDAPGETYTLQLTPSTVAYQPQTATGTIDFSRIRVTLPTVTG